MGYENREREHREWTDEFGTFEIGWNVIGKWGGAAGWVTDQKVGIGVFGLGDGRGVDTGI
jgi:hypothetical protein